LSEPPGAFRSAARYAALLEDSVPPGLVVVVVVELEDEELQADRRAAPARPTANIGTMRLRWVRLVFHLVTGGLPFGSVGCTSVVSPSLPTLPRSSERKVKWK
jgi:hypothetical protein